MAEQLVEIINLDKINNAFSRFPQTVTKHVRKGMQESVIEVKKNIVSGEDFPVFMGALRRSIGSEVRSEGAEIVGVVGSSLKDEEYPKVMEFGRKPGTMPPVESLVRWVHLKLQPGEGKELSVAFLVARKIKARGIKGRHFMQKGFDASLGKIQTFMNNAAERIVQEIANGN